MPFGREAGHYKDITALVAVKDPSRIPLAYTYREGDYATQIDIYILSSRLWEDSPFPPPGDHAPRQNRCTHIQCQGNPANPQQNSSSSSSSNGVHSEPTIDLSAWSPRSHQVTPHLEIIGTDRGLKGKGEKQSIIVSKSEGFVLPPLTVFLQRLTQGKHRRPATTNPNLSHEFAQLSMYMCTCLAPTCNPIVIKLFCSLRVVNCCSVSVGVARGNLIATYSHKICVQARSQQVLGEVLDEATLGNTRSTLNTNPMTLCDTSYEDQTGGPKPKRVIKPTHPHFLNPTHPGKQCLLSLISAQDWPSLSANSSDGPTLSANSSDGPTLSEAAL